jgi:hypothetical protein
MAGWLKLHRSIREWEWYDDINVRLTFLHCLVEANFKDKNFKGTLFPRGSFPCGRDQLAKDIGITTQQLRTAFNKLKSTGEITTRTTSKGTSVTVCNYDSYQEMQPADNQQSNQQITNNQPASNHSIRREEPKKLRTTTTNEQFTPPTLEEFTNYLQVSLPKINPEWTPERITRASQLQHETYTDQDWHTGGDRPRKIKNWQTTTRNSMKYQKPWNFGQSQQFSTPQHHVTEFIGNE